MNTILSHKLSLENPWEETNSTNENLYLTSANQEIQNSLPLIGRTITTSQFSHSYSPLLSPSYDYTLANTSMLFSITKKSFSKTTNASPTYVLQIPPDSLLYYSYWKTNGWDWFLNDDKS